MGGQLPRIEQWLVDIRIGERHRGCRKAANEDCACRAAIQVGRLGDRGKRSLI
jgi:hypothetical protein